VDTRDHVGLIDCVTAIPAESGPLLTRPGRDKRTSPGGWYSSRLEIDREAVKNQEARRHAKGQCSKLRCALRPIESRQFAVISLSPSVRRLQARKRSAPFLQTKRFSLWGAAPRCVSASRALRFRPKNTSKPSTFLRLTLIGGGSSLVHWADQFSGRSRVNINRLPFEPIVRASSGNGSCGRNLQSHAGTGGSARSARQHKHSRSRQPWADLFFMIRASAGLRHTKSAIAVSAWC
jgi:hypothetical protein